MREDRDLKKTVLYVISIISQLLLLLRIRCYGSLLYSSISMVKVQIIIY